MKLGAIITTTFVLSFILFIAGVWLKITHSRGADTCITIGLMASMVFIGVSVYEIRSSKSIDYTEKIMWIFALLFFSPIAGLVYILSGRERIVSRS